MASCLNATKNPVEKELLICMEYNKRQLSVQLNENRKGRLTKASKEKQGMGL